MSRSVPSRIAFRGPVASYVMSLCMVTGCGNSNTTEPSQSAPPSLPTHLPIPPDSGHELEWGKPGILFRVDAPTLPVPYVDDRDVYDRVYDHLIGGELSGIAPEDRTEILWKPPGTPVTVLSVLDSKSIAGHRKTAVQLIEANPDQDGRGYLEQAKLLRPWVKVELHDGLLNPLHHKNLGFVPIGCVTQQPRPPDLKLSR